jgi:hypothetical protein
MQYLEPVSHSTFVASSEDNGIKLFNFPIGKLDFASLDASYGWKYLEVIISVIIEIQQNDHLLWKLIKS